MKQRITDNEKTIEYYRSRAIRSSPGDVCEHNSFSCFTYSRLFSNQLEQCSLYIPCLANRVVTNGMRRMGLDISLSSSSFGKIA